MTVQHTKPFALHKILLCLLFLCTPSLLLARDASVPLTFKEEPIEIKADPLQFDPRNPTETKFGKLIWRGGLVLSAKSPHFGGLSGLAIYPDGQKFIAITDRGFWLNGKIEYKDGAPVSLKETNIGPLLQKNGQPVATSKSRGDSEAIAFYQNNLLISFERRHRIVEFGLSNGKPDLAITNLPLPADVRQMKSNDGFEAMDILQAGPLKGAVIVFSESLEKPEGFIKGWLLEGKTAQILRLQRLKGYSITDMEALPDGDLLILERDFKILDGVKMRIRHIRAQDIEPDKDITGDILIEAHGNYSIDNMESIAVHMDSDGKRIITLISDDNFKSYQRTLLLQFEWPKEKQ